MEPQSIIARRIARELKSGMLVNLGMSNACLQPAGAACEQQIETDS
jgi:acyl CoA:acetate/3-ketoacid CoA transferase beta subunit